MLVISAAGRRAARARAADAVGRRAAVPGRAGRARSWCRRRSGRTRCGSACSPGRRCSRSRTASACRCSRWRSSASALLYLQWLPAVRAVAEAHGDPSTRLAFQAEARDFLDARGQARRARRGADDHEPLGGGRPGQGRAARARVGAPARPEGQPDLLRRRAADGVDVPRLAARERRPLGRAAERAAGLLRARRGASCSSAGAKFLKLVYESPRWRIWEVRGTDPPASNGAKLLAAGPNWFMVDASKPTVVRYRYTQYWSTQRRVPEPRAAAAGRGSSPHERRAWCSCRRGSGSSAAGARRGVISPCGAEARS